jgi:hypothetical protein
MATINVNAHSFFTDHQIEATINEIYPAHANSSFFDENVDVFINQIYPGWSDKDFDSGTFDAPVHQLLSIGAASDMRDNATIYIDAIDDKRPSLPPYGEVVIMSTSGELPLNNSQIHRGDTTVLHVYVWGERVGNKNQVTGAYEGLNPVFTGKLSPEDTDENALFKKTIKNGNVVFIGVDERTTYSGTVSSLVYRVYLRPNDFDKKLFEKSKYLYYDFQLDDGWPGGRTYTIEGKASEKVLVTSDVYKG